jgi:hypothetical protein
MLTLGGFHVGVIDGMRVLLGVRVGVAVWNRVGVGVFVTGTSTNLVTSDVTSWVTSTGWMTVATSITGVDVAAGAGVQAAISANRSRKRIPFSIDRLGWVIFMI